MGNVNALALGPGTMKTALLGSAEPASLVAAWDSAWVDLGYCVDEETEILTRRGWLRHDQLVDGDECLGLSAEDGLARWQPINAVHRFAPGRREMVAMRGLSHSSLTTPNHRWLVERRPPPSVNATGRKGGRTGLIFTTTERLHAVDYIPCAAPVVNLPAQPKYDDAFVELVAWWVTEGSEGNFGGLSIYQSETVNPAHCASIRTALTNLVGPARDSMFVPGTAVRPDKATRGRVMVPAWREGEHKGCRVFHLNKAAADPLREVAPGKVIRPEFIDSLTKSQLDLLLSTAIKGDGWHGNKISQSERERLEPLQMAASLAGLRTVLRPMPNPGGDGWIMTIFRRGNAVGARQRRGMTHITVAHDGMIWCPTTPSQTWLARRDGTVYFTGNTFEGHTFTFTTESEEVEVAEELVPVAEVDVKQVGSVQLILAEVTAFHFSLAQNGGTILTPGGYVTFEPPLPGQTTQRMYGWQSTDATERMVWRKCKNTGDMEMNRRKGADKAGIPLELKLLSPGAGIAPWKWWGSVPDRV